MHFCHSLCINLHLMSNNKYANEIININLGFIAKKNISFTLILISHVIFLKNWGSYCKIDHSPSVVRFCIRYYGNGPFSISHTYCIFPHPYFSWREYMPGLQKWDAFCYSFGWDGSHFWATWHMNCWEECFHNYWYMYNVLVIFFIVVLTLWQKLTTFLISSHN